jgi:hypothetical protein
VHDGFQRFALLAEVLRALRIVPEIRVFGELGDFAQADFFLVEVKDTSAALRRGFRHRSAAWR